MKIDLASKIITNKIEFTRDYTIINLIHFVNPFVISFGLYPIEDFISMGMIFSIILLFEIFILKILNFRKYVVMIFYLINYLNFIYPLLQYTIKLNIILFTIFATICYFSVVRQYYKFIYTYLLIYSTIMFSALINFNLQNDTNKFYNKISIKGKNNIYFIGIDGLVSERFYKKFYGNSHPLADTLRKQNFEIIDFVSPGNSTLETYSSLISYQNKNKNARSSWRKIISDKNSNFYKDVNSMGYKKQFIYSDTYFGINNNGPYDVFWPNNYTHFSFYNYISPKWAFPLHAIINNNSSNKKDQFALTYDKIRVTDKSLFKWITIAHIWFPGHTLLNYDGNNLKNRHNYITYYTTSQKELQKKISLLKNNILEKDRNAIIVFWGDHGSYLLRNLEIKEGKNSIEDISRIDIKNDSSDVLLAIYPENLGKKIRNKIKEPFLLFKLILETSNQ